MEVEILGFSVVSDGLLKESANVIVDDISGGIFLYLLADVLVGVDQTLFSSLSYYDQTVSLLFDPLNDLFVEAFRAAKLKWKLWDQAKVDRVVRETCELRDEPTVAAHQLDETDSILN